jgi:signal transduction histidine kinase/DNA-binding response OmpR family regulator/ligand-binding sensor domain-containing protein
MLYYYLNLEKKILAKVCKILFILFFYGAVSAQENSLEPFQKFTISDGLSHDGVTSILEDSRGFLWIGTYDGLNKYNGYDFKTYRNTIDRRVLISNRVRTLAEDKKGVLWIGTDEGITTYNYSKEDFKDLSIAKEASRPIIRKIIIGNKNGLILCATESNGVLVFKDDYTFVGHYLPSNSFSSKRALFYDGIELDDSNYIFTTSIGLVIFNLEKNEFKRVLESDVSFSNALIRIDENTLLATLDSGICVFEYKKQDGSDYVFKFIQKGLESYQFNSASLDKLDNLWLGSPRDGLIHIDDIHAFIKSENYKTSTFKINTGLLRLSSIFTSSDKGAWVGTFNKGVFQFNLKENPFRNYNTEMKDEFGLSSNEILYISAKDNNRVYVSANRGGFGLFNTITGKFESQPLSKFNENGRGSGNIFIDSRNDTWLRIFGKGFCRIKAGSKKIEVVDYENGGQRRGLVSKTITEDKKGNIWIGGDNVYKISLDKHGEIAKVESLEEHPFFLNQNINLVRYIYADPHCNFVWIGTDSNGLYRVNVDFEGALSELIVDQYLNDKNNKHSISSNFVTSIVRLPNNDLWIGTERGGICKVLNSDSYPEFISFSEKQGLSNNVVKNIIYDEEYNLWVSTNIGLNKFNTKDFTFRKFSKKDGLPFESFNYGASKLKNGYIILSGFDGFCYFKPSELNDNEVLPRLEFENLKIFNETIFPGDTISSRVLLEKRLTDLDELHLNYDEDVFTIETASLHYSDPSSHYLKYQLLPINKDWIEVPSDQRFISYSGLQPGDYTLRVMASNSLNKWTVPKELKIIINPPFWKTTQAYVLYVALCLVLLSLIMYVILRIQSLNHKVVIDALEINTVKEVNEAKLRFFSNISHDIKTPLTLISGPIEVLFDRFKGNFDVSEKLQIVKRQSKKIRQLLDQVHDFQKAEANLLKLDYTHFCFDDFIQDLIKDFSFFAKNDQKKLEVRGSSFKVYVWADKDKLEKVFNNLLNNAFKFTKPGDVISIEYYKEDIDLVVSVSDTGKGIDSDDLSHVFERFYQSQKKHGNYVGGSGIGLAFSKRLVEMHYGYIKAESKLGAGTTIKVRLPIIQENIENNNVDQKNHEGNEELILLEEKEYVHNNSLIKEVNPSNIKISGEFADSQIFLAEDNLEMRLFVSGILSKFFKIKTFNNGQECLDAMEEEWPDIVISDLLMPELNGLDLCKAIKTDMKTSHIPVMLLTACTTIDHQIQGIEDGADAYIQKPFNIQHLITRTEALLLNRKRLRERFQIDFPLTLEKNKDDNKNNVFLEKLYSLMETNLDNQELDLDHFAKELYLNRTHFYQKVKAITNQTPFELLKAYRIKKAAEFLVQKRLPVNEVYLMTGFKSRTHFSKLFKETYGVTPGKYASEAIKKHV